jgi:hypothetical protein
MDDSHINNDSQLGIKRMDVPTGNVSQEFGLTSVKSSVDLSKPTEDKRFESEKMTFSPQI